MATIEGIYLADDRDNLIFEYPTSASSPSLKTVLSTLRGSSSPTTGRHNEAIVEVSRTHTVYRRTQGRVIVYAFVRQQGEEESLHLKTIGDGNDSADNEAQTSDGYDQLDADDLDASVVARNETKKNKNKKRTSPSPVNPNFVFVFLHRLITTLLDYFGTPLNPLKIEANYDVMCNLMQELVQGGAPYITDLNCLRELVPFKSSLASSIISQTNEFAKSYVSGGSALGSFSSSGISSADAAQDRVPWRRSNVKYTNNEVFIDLTETVNVVLSTHQASLKSKKRAKTHIMTNRLLTTVAVLEGQIDFTSHLSGMPDVLVNLDTKGHTLGLPSFHRCVRVDKWANREGTLSFIPPDGKSTLVNYTIELDRIPSQRAQRSLGLVAPDFKQGLGVKGNEFEVIISVALQKGVSKIDQMSVEITTEAQQNVKILRLSHGDVQTGKQGRCEWIFEPGQKLGVTAVLRGIVEDSNDSIVDEDGLENVVVHTPTQVKLSYKLKGALASGIRVDAIKITRGLSDVLPYKGVKYITRTGDYVIR